MRWNHLDESAAEKYLNENFGKVWRKYDLLDRGFIEWEEAYTFEKSLIGSFYLTFADEWILFKIYYNY